MKLLAFDTSTETLSVAVQHDSDRWQYSGVGGARASTALIATLLELLGQAGLRLGGLDAICFGAGPGSFTGLRTACAVAQGLAFGAGVPVLPVDSLLAVAEDARHSTLATADRLEVVALLDARMDEIYRARFLWDAGLWSTLQDSALVRPDALSAAALAGTRADAALHLAGNVFTVYAQPLQMALAGHSCLNAAPTASALLRLAPQLLAQGQAVAADQALPRYIRDKVAKTTAERAAEKAQTA